MKIFYFIIIIKFPSIPESILQEVAYNIRSNQLQQNESQCKIIKSFIEDIQEIHLTLLKPDKLKYQTAARILIFIGHINPPKLVETLIFLLKFSKTNDHLSLLVRILTDGLINQTIQPYCEKEGYFSVALEQILNKECDLNGKEELMDLEDDGFYILNMWLNLLKLLKWEKSGKVPALQCKIISRALHFNLISLTSYYCKENRLDILHMISEIIDVLNVPSVDGNCTYPPPIEVILNLTNGSVNYFFACCSESGIFYIHIIFLFF